MMVSKTGFQNVRSIAGIFTLLIVVGCQTQPQSPENLAFSEAVEVLEFADNPDDSEVVAALAWMQEHQRYVNISYLLNAGSHDDIIMEVVKLSGTDRRTSSSAHYPDWAIYQGLKVTPFRVGNPFQLAIASARPDLAKRIAVHHAKLKGDYKEDIPLGAIPSIHELASQPTTIKYHFNYKKGEPAAKAINETVPADAYVNPPGRGLMFRHATAHRVRLGRVYGRDVLGLEYNWKWDDLANSRTHSDGGSGKYANGYADFLAARHAETVDFIYRNFGGDPNEAMPFCILRNGKPWQVCADFTPTQLAGRTTNMNDLILDDNDREERNPGKLKAYVRVGGDPNEKDRYGNSALTFAQNGGLFPGDNDDGPLLDFGQIMAGAAVIAGSTYIANHGAYEKASQFLVGGLSDVATGTTSNMAGMLKQQRQDTALAEKNLQKHIQVLTEKTYITPETWNNTATGLKRGESNNAVSSINNGNVQSKTSKSSLNQNAQSRIPEGMGSHTFTCPESQKTHTLPIPPVEGACLAAAKRMARTTSCNMIDEYPEAMEQYQKACASSIYQ